MKKFVLFIIASVFVGSLHSAAAAAVATETLVVLTEPAAVPDALPSTGIFTRDTLELGADFGGTKNLHPFPSCGIATAAVFHARGTRPSQQDNFCYSSFQTGAPLFFMGVFDGHGDRGGDASAIVAALLPQRIHAALSTLTLEQQKNPALVSAEIKKTFLVVNRDFCVEETFEWDGHLINYLPKTSVQFSGTTAACIIGLHDFVYVAHAGDSRVILGLHKKEGYAHPYWVTRDHEVKRPDELRRILKSGCFITDADCVPLTEEMNALREALDKPSVFNDLAAKLPPGCRINGLHNISRGFGGLASMAASKLMESRRGRTIIAPVSIEDIRFDGSEAKSALPNVAIFPRKNVSFCALATDGIFEPRHTSIVEEKGLHPAYIAQTVRINDIAVAAHLLGLIAYESSARVGDVDNLTLLVATLSPRGK